MITDKINYEKELELQNYNLKYIIKEPSKVSDYDYDGNNLSRRFISTYIHELKFYDRITNINILSLHFSSETCEKIIAALYNVLYEEKWVMICIKNVYIDESFYPMTMAINRFDVDRVIQISVIGINASAEKIVLDYGQVKLFIELLKGEKYGTYEN